MPTSVSGYARTLPSDDLAEHDPREVFDVDLMHDAGVRRHDAEIPEGVLPPAQERVALAVARELELGVQLKGVGAAEVVDLHRVIDDELDRLQRVDAIGIAAEPNHAVAHRGEIDDAGHAGEILQQHARRRERNFLLQLRARLPARKRLDVFRVHEARVFVAQQVFEKDLQRVRKPGDRWKGALELAQAEDFDRLAGERGVRAGAEGIRAAHPAQSYQNRSEPVHGADPASAPRATSSTASAAAPLAPGPPSSARARRASAAAQSASARLRIGRAATASRPRCSPECSRPGSARARCAGPRSGSPSPRVDVHEPPAEPVAQRRQPVDHDHRAAVQRRLHGGGARGGHRHIRDRQHVVGSREHLDRAAAPSTSMFENSRSSSEGARATTNCTPGQARGDQRDGVAHDRQQPLDLVRPAARQQRHDRPAPGRGRSRGGNRPAGSCARARSTSGWPTNCTGTPASR